MTIGAILQISAYSVAQMIVGRIIAGIGNGFNTSTAVEPHAECGSIFKGASLALLSITL